MWWIVAILTGIGAIWVARFLWAILCHCGTPMMGVHFPVDDDFARSHAKTLENLGNAALGQGRAWIVRRRGVPLGVLFILNPNDPSSLSKLIPYLITICLFYGPVVGLKPIGKLKFTITSWPLPETPAVESEGETDEYEDEPIDEYDDEWEVEDEDEDEEREAA